ncbi:MAG TPA: glycyl-radical enzyme activating protein [bacterium]|nr:glycyl-radical enzyme activating protein [bacterium]
MQYNCIYDGPGIRTCVFFKGCPLRCAWCHNPESQRLDPQMSYFAEKCVLCGSCMKTCPNHAIQITKKRMERNVGKCALCGECARVCPNGAMEKIGREVNVGEVVEIVMRDEPFYKNSGGGVTISGGEPTLQSVFLLELLSELKNKGIHTAIETSGYFEPDLINELCKNTDLFLFDIKHADPAAHKAYTGVTNEKIMFNLKSIFELVGQNRIIPRIPMIPGFNTNTDTIENIIKIIIAAGYFGSVHIMHYNNTARSKWEKIGRGLEYCDYGKLSDEETGALKSQFEKAGFEVVIN